MFERIAVLGGGAWGTALAMMAKRAGRDVTLWAREDEVVTALRAGEGNPLFLKGVDIGPMAATTDLSEALAGADAVLSVVPAQFARSVFARAVPDLAAGTPVALCSKGIEQSTLSLQTDVLKDTLPQAVPGVLSGPSFAVDVAKGLPTAVTIATETEALGQAWMASLGQSTFRPYWSKDLIGAEIGGAVKNVLAIACGIVDGLDLGKSAHAALITRGFAEMVRLGEAMGARLETLSGLCGLGDLVLTCSSPQSRNMSFGRALGQGDTVEAILAARQTVTEGVASAPGVVALAAHHGVDMPICEAVARILAGDVTVEEAMTGLLSRPFKGEVGSA